MSVRIWTHVQACMHDDMTGQLLCHSYLGGHQWPLTYLPTYLPTNLQGSIIIWDNRLIHSTCRPSKGRRLPKPRFIVYGGYVPRITLYAEDVEKRLQHIKKNCTGT